MVKKVVTLSVCLLVAAATMGPGEIAAKDKLRFVFTTVSYAVWNNNVTIGLPKSQGGLGFFEEEGLDVDVTGASGSTDAVKIVGAGRAEASGSVGYGPMVAGVEQGMPIISCFADGLKNKQFIIVPEESPIKSIRDLKGKKVGIYSAGSDGVYFAKAMAKEVGLDPEKDIELVPIGLGAQAVNAIKEGKVAGGAFWDTAIALMEVTGAKFRYLATPGVERIVSGGFAINSNWMKSNRGAAVKFFRAIAKNEIFRAANVPASIRIHWKLFPQTMPAGVPEEKAIKDMTHVLMSRVRGNPELAEWKGKVGIIPKEMWQTSMDFFFDNGIITKKVPVEKVFTNELISEANSFDMQRIIDMARNYK